MSDQIVFQISTPAPSSVDAITTRGSKIDLLATNIAAIDGVYDDINGANNVGTVAADLLGANYTGQVGGMSNEITALYAIRADIEDVADIDAETIVVAGIAANVTTVATNISDINSVVTNLSTYQTANTNFSTYQTAVTNLSTYQTANTNFSVLNEVNNNTAAILAAAQLNGLEVPVDYEAGIVISRRAQTVSYEGNIYTIRSAADLPYTTPVTFNPDKWLMLVRKEPYATVDALIASTEVARGEGSIWEAGGFRYEEAASGATDNHVVTAGGVKLYVLPSNGAYNSEAFGLPINSDDGVSALTAAAAAARTNNGKLFVPRRSTSLVLNSAVDLTGIRLIECERVILTSKLITGVPSIIVGGFANGGTCHIRFTDVTNGDSLLLDLPPTDPIVRVSGLKSSEFQIGSCNHLQFWADEAIAGQGSTAYNTIKMFGVIRKLSLSAAPGFSWITENRFYGGRIAWLSIETTDYLHNHNKFFEPTFEGANVQIDIDGSSNHVRGARFESVAASPGVTFSAASYSNTIEFTWSGTGNPRNDIRIPIPVSDSGMGNDVHSLASATLDRVMVASISPKGMISTATNDSGYPLSTSGAFLPPFQKPTLTPGLTSFSATSFDTLILSDMIPVRLGDRFAFEVDGVGANYRTVTYIFDADGNPITSDGGSSFISLPGVVALQLSGGFALYVETTNLTAANATKSGAIIRSDIGFIRIGVIAYAATTVSHASAYVYCRSLDDGAQFAVHPRVVTPVIAGAPVKGYAPLGSTVYDTVAAVEKRVTYAHETTVNGALVAGDVAVTVAQVASTANDDIIGLLLDDGTTHWSAVSGKTGSTYTIDAIPADRSVANATRCVFTRWV